MSTVLLIVALLVRAYRKGKEWPNGNEAVQEFVSLEFGSRNWRPRNQKIRRGNSVECYVWPGSSAIRKTSTFIEQLWRSHRMYRARAMHFLAALAVLCVGIALATTGAMAAGNTKIDKAKLVGSWTLVSISNTGPDGKTVQTYGANDGMLVFEANGAFVQVLARPDLPKFASNNRNAGTADENKAAVQGSLSIFGKYTINAKDGSLTLHIDRSSYPNWNGADQKRVVASLTGTELKWEIPAPSVGGSSVAVWKRGK